jgi:2-keto-3-deoxy-L-rhamnonate aldolase RhmA
MSHKDKNFDYGIDINLGASDIVNGAGPQYTIKEIEMESAIKQVLDECEKHGK